MTSSANGNWANSSAVVNSRYGSAYLAEAYTGWPTV